MRIVFVSHSLPLPGQPTSNIGGMQRVAMELRGALDDHPGVDLLTMTLESTSRWNGVQTALFLPSLLRRLPELVDSSRPHAILFSSMVTAATLPAIRMRLARRGVVISAIPIGRDVTLPNPIYQRLVPKVLASLDVAFPISTATGAECVGRGLDPERMQVVPCGIDIDRFPEIGDRGATRSELLRALAADHVHLPQGAFLLLALGRHQERKGFHWFVERVMPRLPEDVVLLLGGEGPMTSRIRGSVEREGLQGRVKLLGRVSEEMLPTLYRGADLFLMPNIPVAGDIEGFGVVMLEAGVCGLPTIGADLEGIRDVLKEGENGHLLPSGDAQAFAAAIESYRSDRAALESMSSSARDSVVRRFAWGRIVDQYLEHLGKVGAGQASLR